MSIRPDSTGAAPVDAAGVQKLPGNGLRVAALTMLSRVAGLIRDVAIATVFGAGGAADAFFLAFRIPNLFRRLFAEGAFSASFVPVLAEFRVRGSRDQVRDLVSHVSGLLGAVLALVTLVGMVGAPVVIRLIAPGIAPEDERFALAVYLLRLTFPYLFLISLVALTASIQNSYGRFWLPAFAPVLLNVCLIGAVLLAGCAEPPVVALGWGVLVAGVLQLLIQLPSLRRLGMLVRPRFNPRHPGVVQVVTVMGPAMLGAATTQINLLVDTLLASFLPDGSISWLYYADRLMELPVGLVAVAVATVVLPSLAASHTGTDPKQFDRTLDWGVRVVLLLVLPASLALAMLAEPLIVTIFNYGALTANDATQAGAALLAYALGVPGLVLVKVLATGYFGRQDTRTPVRASVVAVVVNIGLNLVLIGPLAHVGLALATAVAGTVNASLLGVGLLRSRVWTPDSRWVRTGGVMVLANGGLGCWLWWAAPANGWWLAATAGERLGMLAGLVASGMLVYGVGAFAGGLRPTDLRPADATQEAG